MTASVATKTKTIQGEDLLSAFRHAAQVIADHRDQLNALNVFPVPDGDTGTNMSLTMKSAVEEVLPPSRDFPHTASSIASQIAHGALMGARGNSGVILSQMLRGFSTAIEGRSTVDAHDIVRALAKATEVAYTAVANPVEGTMLSVIGDAARAGGDALKQSKDVVEILVAAADGAAAGLARTPDALEILRRANVVDAGGQGVAYILRAIANSLHGDFSEIQIGVRAPVLNLANLSTTDVEHFFGEPGYCTNFLVMGHEMDPDAFRRELGSIGTSIVVVGDPFLFKVHVHTDRPDEALGLGLSHGTVDRISIDYMQSQMSEIASSIARQPPASSLTVAPEMTGEQAVVAVADGPGFVDILLTMGATAVVHPRNGAKPSTEELLEAIESSSVDDVILLPNASETIGTAEIATGLSHKKVVVVPSTSVVAGIGALEAMNPSGDIESNAKQMRKALDEVRYVEIATATKDAGIDGVDARVGQLLFFANGTLVASGDTLPDILTSGLSRFLETEPEIIAVFTGRDADPAQTSILEEIVVATFPDAELEILEGGQSSWQYVISFE